MNKRTLIIILLILFVPSVLGAAWFFSVSGSVYSTSNVSQVFLSDGENEWEYTDDVEKEFFVSAVNNFVSIEKQMFSPDVWSVYALALERTFETDIFYLCLSPDARNCLAYDEDGNWFRINTEDARKILVREELEGVYTASTYPKLSVNFLGESHLIPSREYEWSYLLANGSFSTTRDSAEGATHTDFNISASVGLDISFSITPDWCDVKIFDGDALVFSGDLSTLNTFSFSKDGVLKALVSAVWYQDDSRLYYGTTLSEFVFNYDIRATASVNKETFVPGEIAWVTLDNAYNEVFDIQTNLETSEKLVVREYNGKHYLSVPISMNNKTGEYTLSLISSNSNIQLKLIVSERLLEDAKVKLLSSTAQQYQSALENFDEEISLQNYESAITEPLWKDGFVTPVIKFQQDKECYWISAPSYGTVQIVDGMKISVKNFGTHYVKSVDFEFIEARAVADGKIAFSGTTSAFGNTLVIDHGFGLFTVYGHLENLLLKQGDDVKKYDVIGASSNGGIVMKEGQLFFAILQDGVFVNPYMLINEQKNVTSPALTNSPIEF